MVVDQLHYGVSNLVYASERGWPCWKYVLGTALVFIHLIINRWVSECAQQSAIRVLECSCRVVWWFGSKSCIDAFIVGWENQLKAS